MLVYQRVSCKEWSYQRISKISHIPQLTQIPLFKLKTVLCLPVPNSWQGRCVTCIQYFTVVYRVLVTAEFLLAKCPTCEIRMPCCGFNPVFVAQSSISIYCSVIHEEKHVLPAYSAFSWLVRSYNMVGGFNQPLWNMMELKSVGMMTFPIWWESHKIPWFQSPPTSDY